ncbi:hypothetical protein [Paraburkholderia sediminicola]|uniref:hypothetical protein n=1 Tax=Paraburkholderia sediminicola TaxID=458836 RepID=UPI0038B9CE27
MSEEKGFLRHPIVVAVIAGLTVPAGLAVASYEGVTVENTIAWLARVAKFWHADVTLSRWSFWLWAVFTIGLALIVALRLYFFLAEESEAQPAQPSKRTSAQPHQAYVTDLLFNWRWRWKTSAAGEIWDIGMYCPKCDQQLVPSDFGSRRYDEHYCVCSHCAYRAETDGDSPAAMYHKVKLAAERKIRTGEWEKAGKPAKSAAR